MKTLSFRPLRRVKKTGKIVVTSYMGWNKLRTADYNKFNLIISDEYKLLPKDEYVYNHEGKLLYFFTYNPADVPVYDSTAERILDENWLDKLHDSKQPFGIKWDSCPESHVNYSRMDGTDCVGVPTFSHWTEDYISQEDTWNYYGHDKFEPLTVGTVVKWFGWFLWQLNNVYLKTK